MTKELPPSDHEQRSGDTTYPLPNGDAPLSRREILKSPTEIKVFNPVFLIDKFDSSDLHNFSNPNILKPFLDYLNASTDEAPTFKEDIMTQTITTANNILSSYVSDDGTECIAKLPWYRYEGISEADSTRINNLKIIREWIVLNKLYQAGLAVPQPLGIGQHEDSLFLVMAKVDIENLGNEKAITKPPETFDQAKERINALLNILEIAHQMDILHLDIKPSNIWIEKNTNKLMLGDWGEASILENIEGDQKKAFLYGSTADIAPKEISDLYEKASQNKPIKEEDRYVGVQTDVAEVAQIVLFLLTLNKRTRLTERLDNFKSDEEKVDYADFVPPEIRDQLTIFLRNNMSDNIDERSQTMVNFKKELNSIFGLVV